MPTKKPPDARWRREASFVGESRVGETGDSCTIRSRWKGENELSGLTEWLYLVEGVWVRIIFKCCERLAELGRNGVDFYLVILKVIVFIGVSRCGADAIRVIWAFQLI